MLQSVKVAHVLFERCRRCTNRERPERYDAREQEEWRYLRKVEAFAN
jgi:hypothetical protein